MKKLKLQKALLTICLALATTLKISKEINAMEAKKLKETAILSLSQEKTSQQSPKGYIKNDPVRYLALLIQAANGIIKLPENARLSQNKTSEFIHNTFFENDLDYIENKESMTDEIKNSQVELITNYLRHLQQLENRATAVE